MDFNGTEWTPIVVVDHEYHGDKYLFIFKMLSPFNTFYLSFSADHCAAVWISGRVRSESTATSFTTPYRERHHNA